MRTITAAALTLALLTIAPVSRGEEPPAAAEHVLPWPFGVEARSPGSQALDLYNLGLLGAKAGDAAVPRRDPGPAQSGKRSVNVAREADDDGPEALRVDILYPGGPAEKAGLRSGDVIVGVGGKSFQKNGSLGPLADALLKAESGAGKGVLTLKVERPGEKGQIKLEVPIPQGGKPAADPTSGAGRTALVDAALRFLAERQAADGGYKETLSGTNGAVVQTSLAGLCWLGGGSDLENGPYKDNVRRAAEFVAAHLDAMGGPTRPGGGASWDQSNWGWAHAAIFLGELNERTPTEEFRAVLLRAGKELAERQEESGGWAHGPGGPNALGYVELNIVSGLALTGLGLARQAGYEVPQAVIDKAEAFLVASSSGDGGVGYSDNPGQAGQGNIGRTAGAWLGYVNLGLGKRPWCRKMEGYVRRYAGDILGGHASLMQHVMLAGVAAHALGSDARKSYWETAKRDLVLARAPDGSFQPRPWAETKSIGSNGDVTFGEIWSTCAWTLPLVTEPSEDGKRPGLPAWSGRNAGTPSHR